MGMRAEMRIVICGLMAILPLAAQQLKLPPGLEKLGDKASNVIDITLDASMLQLASRFLSDKDPDEVQAKKLVGKLKSIMVKSFEFDRRAEYEQSDLDELRAQWRGPGWSRIVGVRSKKDGENADVYLKSDGNQVTGVAILVADPKELTIVYVDGTLNPDDVRDLQGHFGIPKIDMGKGTIRKDGGAKEDER
jgi:hypothetical protein